MIILHEFSRIDNLMKYLETGDFGFCLHTPKAHVILANRKSLGCDLVPSVLSSVKLLDAGQPIVSSRSTCLQDASIKLLSSERQRR